MSAILPILREEFELSMTLRPKPVPRIVQFPEISQKIMAAIGMRRVGKTYLLFEEITHLLERGISLDRILYINFEDDRLFPHLQSQLTNLVDEFYQLFPDNHEQTCYLFFDEIQNVENWSLVIRRLFDTKLVQIFLTGSSAKLLSKEISTELRGRSFAIEVYPFSFKEYLIAKKIMLAEFGLGQVSMDKLFKYLLDYINVGGFPEVVNVNTPQQVQLLRDYVDVVIYRDIIERHKSTNTTLIKYLIQTLLHSAGCSFSINKFYNDLKSQGINVAKDTVYEYLRLIEDTYLTFSVPLYSPSIRKVQTNPKKIYLIDTGLINAHTLRPDRDLGHLFENLIYLDLRRQGHKIYYYLTKERYEIDFLIQTLSGEMKLIQVLWDENDNAALARERRALHAAEKELNISGEIITPQSYLRGLVQDENK